MSLIVWSDKLSVGIASIDGEHKKLIKMVNDMNDAMKAGKGNDVVGTMLDELVAYTVRHFATEERLFARHGYPETDAHKKEHEKLKADVTKFVEDFKSGKSAVAIQLFMFLKKWLESHIKGTDSKYSSFLIDKGVK